MNYVDRTLIFEENKIYYIDEGIEFEIMMNWEDSIMKASSDYICENGGDILEIGFGMGISAGYIQSHSISSHTIVENHPQILEKLQTWVSGKSNVTIVSQSWSDAVGSLGTYDGIFFDVTMDSTTDEHFSASIASLIKSGSRCTFFWGSNNDLTQHPKLSFVDSFQQISVSPSTNTYWTGSTTYYMPKAKF